MYLRALNRKAADGRMRLRSKKLLHGTGISGATETRPAQWPNKLAVMNRSARLTRGEGHELGL